MLSLSPQAGRRFFWRVGGVPLHAADLDWWRRIWIVGVGDGLLDCGSGRELRAAGRRPAPNPTNTLNDQRECIMLELAMNRGVA